MSVRDKLKKLRNQPGYIYEGLKYDLSEQLYDLMKEKGLTKKELAERMGVTPAYITKIFGAENISLKTVAKVLAALEAGDVTIKLLPKSSVKAVDEFMRLFKSVNFTTVSFDLNVEDLEYEGEEISNAA